jgi:hypothetical protein
MARPHGDNRKSQREDNAVAHEILLCLDLGQR